MRCLDGRVCTGWGWGCRASFLLTFNCCLEGAEGVVCPERGCWAALGNGTPSQAGVFTGPSPWDGWGITHRPADQGSPLRV